VATSFAHPVERALARLFDEHGIAWEYEPHTFVLEWDADGTVREAFTPDFFLPEIGAYVTSPEVSFTNAAGTEARTMNQIGALEPGTRVRIGTERYGESWVVNVVGDVDLHSAPELRDRLASLGDTGAKHIVVDLSECQFLDSMGLGVLLGAKKRMARDGRELHVVVTSPDVRRIFEITMLDRVLDLHATRAEALNGDRARRPF
jgi:anti-sigma B factor antagonist